jgi:DNA-binding NarL/FixJ family response regulator
MEPGALQFWFFLQILLEVVLVALMAVIFFKIRRMNQGRVQVPPEVDEAMQRFITQSEKLSETFDRALREKKEISVDLLLKLDHRIQEINGMLDRAERDLDRTRNTTRSPSPELESVSRRANPAAPENRALVVRLAGQGQSVSEIARRTGLQQGEIELILDLERQFDLES